MLRKKLMVLLAAVLAMVSGVSSPAAAQVGPAPGPTTVFVPPQIIDAGGHQYRVRSPGGTLACSGAPFTTPSGTCTPLGDRAPDPGLVCDSPARVLAFGVLPLSAFACHTPSVPETEITPAPSDLIGTGSNQFVTTDNPNSFNSVRFR
jgi:hypothetical protein